MIDLEISAETILSSEDLNGAVRLLRLALAQVWEDSHEHCTDIGCANPYRD